MKEISVFIRADDLSKVTNILLKHKAGITFFEIEGTGRTPRAAPEIIHSYVTGKTVVPMFVRRIKVETVVPDSSAEQIVSEILNSFSATSEPYGVLFIKNVHDAYELGTKLKGDDVLTSQ
jgi:nitrogen regulatory protein P-II 1